MHHWSSSKFRQASAMTAVALALVTACAPAPDGPTPGGPASQPPSPSETHTPAPSVSAEPAAPDGASSEVSASLEGLESTYDARVAVSAVDSGTGQTLQYREGERFGFASILKVFAAAELLNQVPDGERNELVRWTQDDVDAAGYSPLTVEHVDSGLTLLELAEAAVRLSDNTAMNLVLDRIGGPEGMNQALTQWGDDVTQVVDIEPALNEVDQATGANTTTAAAFTSAMLEVLGPDHLTAADRELLLEWMSGNTTGDTLIRAGAPHGWDVVDKSGGSGALRNDVAVVTPPEGEPIVMTVLTERNDSAAAYDDALVAQVAAVVLEHFAG